MIHPHCLACGSLLIRHNTGRPKVYCSTTCKREHNKERKAATDRAWYARTRERQLALKRVWYTANKDHHNAKRAQRMRDDRRRSISNFTEMLAKRLSGSTGLAIGTARRTVAAVAISVERIAA